MESDRIDLALPSAKRGTLRIWGEWFGRPYDNFHRAIRRQAFDEGLRFSFNGNEVLTIWEPRDVVVGEARFEVGDASRVRWEWYLYGCPKAAANLRYLDYVRGEDFVTLVSNAEWRVTPERLSISGPAVELV